MLQHPLNPDLILRKKNSIRRTLISKEGLISKNIAILAGSTISEIKNILELFLLNAGIKPTFYVSEYNQYYEDAIFENKALQAFQPDIIYIHTTNKNITSYPFMQDSKQDVQNKLQQEMTWSNG